MKCKICKELRPCPNPYYVNVAWFHLHRPRLKLSKNGIVDGHPIIFVDIGNAQ